VCIAAFTIGQFIAPPEYHLQAGNPWGNLFGTSVVVGIVSFALAVLFFIIDKARKKDIKKASVTKT